MTRAAVGGIHVVEIFRLDEKGRSRWSAGRDRAHIKKLPRRADGVKSAGVAEIEDRFMAGRRGVRRWNESNGGSSRARVVNDRSIWIGGDVRPIQNQMNRVEIRVKETATGVNDELN